jgi:sugar phosphate permease
MLPTAESPGERVENSWLPRVLRPAPPAPQISDPEQIRRDYTYFRPRILLWTTIGYAAFYFVRKNLSMAMPIMEEQLGIEKTSLGIFLTLHGVVYGISKFGNGIIGDRADGRKFMALGLAASAILNIFFGFSTAVIAFGIIWMVNGYFQGMGYPPCARLLAHWFSPKELATKMAYWNASHSLGGAGILILCGFLLKRYPNNWQICFFVPAGIAMAVAAGLMLWLRDTPESVGLPEIEGTHVASSVPEAAQTAADYRAFLWERVFSDKYIWIVSIANFFVYVLRYGIFDWVAVILKEVKGIEVGDAAWMGAGFEFAGLFGILISGWLTDRVFRGRGAPLCIIWMLAAGLMIYLFWLAPPQAKLLNTALLAGAGFFIYGPQALAAVIVVKLATKRAAATAVGLTSIFGYASTILSGWGVGYLAKNYGWDYVFWSLVGFAAVGAILFAIALPGYVDDYSEPVPK